MLINPPLSNAPRIDEDELCCVLLTAATVAASSKAATTVCREILALVSTYIEAPAFCANVSAWSAATGALAGAVLSLLET